MKMLDIGVGTGRTTPYFANLVKEYVRAFSNGAEKIFYNIWYDMGTSRDFVIASIHSGLTDTREKVTTRTLKAMDNPYVH